MACIKFVLDGIHVMVDEVLVVRFAATFVSAKGASFPTTIVQAASFDVFSLDPIVFTLTRWIVDESRAASIAFKFFSEDLTLV